MTLTADDDKMRAEVTRLHHQLESEKSRSKKMQSDLQRELQGVFDENTKLTTLLDGKVPRSTACLVLLYQTTACSLFHSGSYVLNPAFLTMFLLLLSDLIDSVELERKVSELKKELQACREEEGTLRAKLEDLAGLQDLPDKVDGLTKQVNGRLGNNVRRFLLFFTIAEPVFWLALSAPHRYVT